MDTSAPLAPDAAVFAWTGGGLFVAALGYYLYTYLVTLALPAPPGTTGGAAAVATDAVLFFAFATHHSLFVRVPARRWIIRVVSAPLERSVYVWMSSLLLIAACAAWRPIPGTLYDHHGLAAAVHLSSVAAGIGLTVLGARLLRPLDLAGITQARARIPETTEPLVTRFPYSVVRHPIYLGWMLVVFGVPRMTWNRLLMASLSSAYLLVAVPWEERRLARAFGAAYDAYRQRVRWRIVPFIY
jgi:methanethiol S-methyltransferase